MKGVANYYSIEDFFNIFLEGLGEEKESFEFTYAAGLVFDFLQVLIYRKHKLKEKWDIYGDFEVLSLIEDKISSQFELVDGELYESIPLNNNRRFVIATGYEEIVQKIENKFEKDTLTKEEYENLIRILKGFRLKQIL
ncbi:MULTISPECIES: hypothetical protein [Bacillus cereus group]|uniref:hypothetical protein n=1 Tax=Bacillus cereus group TaxID=86661 RepID=UPI0021CFFE28|nr:MULTISPECIES: hypothetical protein [Bacillus cereus group]MCU5201666.1 hypothetical protein [Bacillus paranthracis]MCU5374694.1 hypothetical protein [Bacillus pacificus]